MDSNMQSLKAAEWNAPEPSNHEEEPVLDIGERDEQIAERQSERFEIKDDTTANWAFQRLAELEKELDDKTEQYKVYIDQAEEWKRRETCKLTDSIDYFKQLIERYRRALPNGKVNVPAGKTMVKHTKKAMYDDVKLLDFTRINYPSLIKTSYAVNKADLKKRLTTDGNGHYIDEDGQIVSGMHYEETETVTYKVN